MRQPVDCQDEPFADIAYRKVLLTNLGLVFSVVTGARRRIAGVLDAHDTSVVAEHRQC